MKIRNNLQLKLKKFIKNSVLKFSNKAYFPHDSNAFSSKESSNIKLNNNLNNNNSNSNFLYKKEDYEKIIYYKKNLIFKTPEEFQDRLKYFEKENIILLKYYNELYSQIFQLKQELNSIIKDKEKSELEYNDIFRIKTKELENIKYLVETKMKLISDFKKDDIINLELELNKEKDKKNSPKRKLRKKSVDFENITEKKNINLNFDEIDKRRSLLYKKVNIIFESCKTVGRDLSSSSYILNLVNKKMNTKEKEMILMLVFIEQSIDYLISNYNFYMNKNEEIQTFIGQIKSDIEKEHKIEKSKIQMMNDLEKENLLKEKVEKRSNKIYFLPNKKIDLNNFKFKLEIRKLRELHRNPTIQDYLYNEEQD